MAAPNEGVTPNEWQPNPTTQYNLHVRGPRVIELSGGVEYFSQNFKEGDTFARRQVHSALVQAVMAGSLTLDMAECGMLPAVEEVAKHTTMPKDELRKYLNALPTGWLVEACWSADTVCNTSTTESRPRQPKPSTDSIVAPVEQTQDPVENEDWFVTWGEVRTYYDGSLTRPLGEQQSDDPDDNRKSWGAYYVKDLTRYPALGKAPLLPGERQALEERFITLNGIPYMADPTQAHDTMRSLPSGIPGVCVLQNGEVLLRGAHELQVVADNLGRQELSLINLIVLRSLRNGGSVGTDWLREMTGYNQKRFTNGLEGLIHKIGEDFGALIRTKSGRNPHYRLQDDMCIIDARPRANKE